VINAQPDPRWKIEDQRKGERGKGPLYFLLLALLLRALIYSLVFDL